MIYGKISRRKHYSQDLWELVENEFVEPNIKLLIKI